MILTSGKNYIFTPFVDTITHRTIKLCNFDIKYQGNSGSYERHIFLGPILGDGQNVLGFFFGGGGGGV